MELSTLQVEKTNLDRREKALTNLQTKNERERKQLEIAELSHKILDAAEDVLMVSAELTEVETRYRDAVNFEQRLRSDLEKIRRTY